ncbi:DUF3134 family protein [Waterburya agarophytonicola K14]|uniref:DUF3134 family protein n=1 Tax=Waterburya agarophytonicola KI4 TaxID=2874699 RepID=A0A964BNV6_9CYAN|nr:DUF3134 family protein [Waterburya agarophytonicola]MCC0175456.1 DUF3134 family protein [Waterburya agarophytonicola KI4]
MERQRKNPALQQEPVGEPASIIAPRENESLFMWIKSTGRFMPYQSDRFVDDKTIDELDDILNDDEETETDTEE